MIPSGRLMVIHYSRRNNSCVLLLFVSNLLRIAPSKSDLVRTRLSKAVHFLQALGPLDLNFCRHDWTGTHTLCVADATSNEAWGCAGD